MPDLYDIVSCEKLLYLLGDKVAFQVNGKEYIRKLDDDNQVRYSNCKYRVTDLMQKVRVL